MPKTERQRRAAYAHGYRGEEPTRRPVNLQLTLALDALHEPLAFWIHYNDPQAKRDLLAAYEALPPPRRAALDQAVHQAFDGPTIIAYRRMKPGDVVERMGGMSLSTDKPSYTNYEAFELRPEDVLIHWAVTYPDGDTTPLGSKAFGHEHELILRRDAHPMQVSSAPRLNERRFGRHAREPALPRSEFILAGNKALDAISNLDDVPPGYLQGLALGDAAYRALEAGPELRLQGRSAQERQHTPRRG